MDKTAVSKLKVSASMFIFGTIGIFVRYIPLPSSVIAMMRAFIGTAMLLLFLLLGRGKMDIGAIKKNIVKLTASSVMMAINWILLFEAYRYTTVATATLCYYMSPIILVALSPLIFKEKLSLKKLVCILTALLGMVFVSGVIGGGGIKLSEMTGIIMGLLAACFYAAVVITNKTIKGLPSFDRTIMQLAIAAIVMLPYNAFTGALGSLEVNGLIIVMLLIVGNVHTGLAYCLYFGSMEYLNSQTLAILSYVDPVVAVLLSALLLREPMSIMNIIGAVLILGAAVISEMPEKKK